MIRLLLVLDMGLLAFIYLGFPLVLWALARFRARTIDRQDCHVPDVTLILTAFNEEKSIGPTLENVLRLDYPSDRMEILVASDGSTDETDRIVEGFRDRGVVLVRCPRAGKEVARAAAVERSGGDLLLFGDADHYWQPDAVRRLVGHFADPRVGAVSGKTVYGKDTDNAIVSGSTTYWQYEEFTKRQEGRLGCLIAADGPIFAVRRSLFEPVPQAGAADMVVPVRVLEQGFLSLYDPDAMGREEHRKEAKQEIGRRIRIIVRGLTNLWILKRNLNPIRNPKTSFLLIFHKLLRWMAPVFLLAGFILNFFLVFDPPYSVLFGLQLLFLGSALVGLGTLHRGRNPFHLAYYFCLINYCALVGLIRFLRGGRAPTWDPGT